ncbi:MAG: hypothetical protein ACSLEY_00990 [Candidatus Saccharimonadales bacterium]
MAYERLSTVKGEQSLAPLATHSELLNRRNGQLIVLDKLETPVDEYGIPQPHLLIKDVLGSVAISRVWTGGYDVHHVAWPEAAYHRYNDETESLTGSYFRGAAALKVRLPRQLHNYIHAVTEPSPMPSEDVMQQWIKEQRQVSRLYDTVSRKNLSDATDLSEEQREKYRFNNYRQKLDTMEDGELGLMPNREQLASIDIDQARRILRAIAKVRGFSNSRRQQRVFLAGTPRIAIA